MIEINNQVKARISLKFIKRVLNKALKKLKKKANISVALVDSRTICKLNKKYRGVNKVTDILSFSFKNTKYQILNTKYFGELIICYPQAKKQAKELEHTLKEELKLLLIHGVLHLLGYEHKDRKSRMAMEKVEAMLLNE